MGIKQAGVALFSCAARFPAGHTGDSILGIMFSWDVLEYKDFSCTKCDDGEKGPYRWLKHPNYVVVAIELMLIPLLFNAYFTAILFTCLNAWMMAVRIQTEEKALNQYLLN